MGTEAANPLSSRDGKVGEPSCLAKAPSHSHSCPEVQARFLAHNCLGKYRSRCRPNPGPSRRLGSSQLSKLNLQRLPQFQLYQAPGPFPLPPLKQETSQQGFPQLDWLIKVLTVVIVKPYFLFHLRNPTPNSSTSSWERILNPQVNAFPYTRWGEN